MQVQWSPDGNYLYTGARKDPHILCWDVRYSQSTVYSIQRRAANTNQKICFDIEPCGRHLVSGGEDGFVTVFDLTDGQLVARYRASTDATNGTLKPSKACSLHPHLKFLSHDFIGFLSHDFASAFTASHVSGLRACSQGAPSIPA
jgi:WD40 repeat protein